MGPDTEFLENRSITSMNSAYHTLFSHDAVYSLQRASYLLFETSGRVDADYLKRMQSAVALCNAELPYGVIQSGTEATGAGELTEIINANRRDFESLFGQPVDYYVLDVDVDSFGMETDLLTTLRFVDVATKRGIAASALSHGIQDVGNASLSVKAMLDHLTTEKQIRKKYDTAMSRRIDFQKAIMVGNQPRLVVEWKREIQDAITDIRRQMVGKFAPYNGGELFARMKECIRSTNVNPRRKKKVLALINELERLFSAAAAETWGEATAAFESQIVEHTNKVLHELIDDAIHRWGVEEEISVEITPKWDDGPDPKISVDLDISIVSSAGEVVFRVVVSTAVFASIGFQLAGTAGAVIAGIVGFLLAGITLIVEDRRKFNRHVESEIRNALVAAGQEMGFQFDKLTTSFVRQGDDTFGGILTAIFHHLDSKLAEFKHVPSLSVDELDKKIKEQSQVYADLEELRQDMVILHSKLSTPEPV